MNRISIPAPNSPVLPGGRTVALGMLDGVHIGHRAVLVEALCLGDGDCDVFTFDPDTLTTKPGFCALCSPEEQYRVLEQVGVSCVYEADFSAFRDLSPEAFADFLVNTLHATGLVCGFNYRFGKNGVGDAALLKELGAARHIPVRIVPAVESDGITVSSTAIRAALQEGDIPTARRLLGRAYGIRGVVQHGNRIGRRLQTPTVNLPLSPEQTLLRHGVYVSSVEIGDAVYAGVTNVGTHPTVGETEPQAETWIDGFEGDLYGQTVTVYLVAFIRDEETFPSVEALQAQITKDIAAARALTAPAGHIRAVLFDFDDTLGPRDPAFTAGVHGFMERWYPTLDEEERKSREKEMIHFNAYGYRMTVTYPEFIALFLEKWPPEKPETPEKALHALWFDFFSHYTLFPETLRVLDSLREAGLTVGVITNGLSYLQNSKLDATGVRPHTDITAVSGTEGVHKPDKSIFLRVAARLGIAPEDCLYVGDNPKNDIFGSLGAGMHAAWLDTELSPDHPCYDTPVPPQAHRIRSLDEVAGVIQKINNEKE